MLLATDLDGTFLGGTPAERKELYDWLERHRDCISIMFVTGRDLTFIRSLIDSGSVPTPDHVIGNVGTTAVTGPQLTPIAEVEAWIESLWPADAPAHIAALLEGHHHLTLQQGIEGRRVSYYYTDAEKARESAEIVREAGYDALLSADIFFDVLPRGVQKGPTLERVVQALGLSRERVLVAGDTLNDLSLFETGMAGVAVGNSEPKLVEKVRRMPNVKLARGTGAKGILEVLEPMTDAK